MTRAPKAIVAHGTEGPGNSYRHNRVRETELFRHFMPYGHMYKHEEGSYGYGGYSRLPFDQALARGHASRRIARFSSTPISTTTTTAR